MSLNKFPILFRKEMRTLVSAPSLWIMLLVESPLLGYGFIQAVYLFTQASRSAVKFAELAKGMEPMQGIFVPTFGALYLVLTLLFPFVAIRLMRQERDSGSLKLLLQSPLRPLAIVLAKLSAASIALILSFIPIVCAVIVWLGNGGHLYLPALFLVLFAYCMYGLLVCAIAFTSSIISDSASSAAILTLAITLGIWVLDFAGSTSGILRQVSFISFTESLRQFETGIFSSPDACRLALTLFALVAISTICIVPGRRLARKIQYSLLTLAFLAAAAIVTAEFPIYADLSEDKHNSFNPAFERALKNIKGHLQITVNLSADDSRLKEMENNVLAKLRRSVADLTVVIPESASQQLFTNPDHDNYGLIFYEYEGKREEGRSNSPTEILPILFKLAGQNVEPEVLPAYSGYPLVLESTNSELLFYLVLPAAFLAGWRYLRRVPKIMEFDL